MEDEITILNSMGNGISFQKNGKIYFLEKYYIANFWIRYGGSFIKEIGKALLFADSENTIKILDNWEENIELNNILQVFKEDFDFEKNELPF